jgi:hypothetical protein
MEEVPSDEKKKERPLAARRNLVTSSSSQNLNETRDNDTSSSKVVDPGQDPEVESIDDFAKMSSSKKAEAASSSVKSSLEETPQPVEKASSSFTPTSPTTKEIEKAIKEQTAEFDKSVLKKGPAKVKQTKPVGPPSTPLQVHHVMKLIRLIGIIVLGILIGMLLLIDSKCLGFT